MKLTNLKNKINFYIKEIKNIDLKALYESINNFKIDDIKNINYRRLFINIRRSKLTKPTIGIFSAVFFSSLVLNPEIQSLSQTFKKVKQYRFESKNLQKYKDKLTNKNKIFEKTSSLMFKVNNSILEKDEVIFVTRLINEASRKSNVKINSFSPLLKADTSKLCKASKFQMKDKTLKSRRRKTTLNKGLVSDNFFEVKFSSNYLDILTFLKELQLYDVIIIPYCLDVSSDKVKLNNINKQKNNTSTIVSIDNQTKSNNSLDYEKKINLSDKSGEVETKIILQIPAFTK